MSCEGLTGGRFRNGLLLRAELSGGAGFGILGRPIFRRKGYAPEIRTWRPKFNPNFRFATSDRAEKGHMAFLFFFSFVVLHVDYGAANYPRIEQYQSAVRVDGKSLSHFLKILALGVLAANPDTDLHKHALAAAARSGM